MWLVWSGGNDRFWNGMSDYTFGAFDLLKIISSHPRSAIRAPIALELLRARQRALLRERDWGRPEPAWPLARRSQQRLRRRSVREREQVPGRRHRLARQAAWRRHDAAGRFVLRLGDRHRRPAPVPEPGLRREGGQGLGPRELLHRPELLQPQGPGPAVPRRHVVRLLPRRAEPGESAGRSEHPEFANLSSSVGAQYMWVDRLFILNSNKPEGRTNYMFQLAHTFRPGTMDTSLVSTDGINNPRTMNAVYEFVARMAIAKRLGSEKLAGGELDNKQFNDFVTSGPLLDFFSKPDATVRTPRVLKDGADSVGLLGALNRVYLNIGLFSEEWLLHFNAVVGGKNITPIKIADAQKNSSYWQATEAGTPNTALFFLKAAQPDRLKDAPGGDKYLTADAATVERGKIVFADTCARCHSSKAPPPPAPIRRRAPGRLPRLLQALLERTQTQEFKEQMRKIVLAPDFLENNYLSTDARIPVTLLRTNACSPLGDQRARRQYLGQLLLAVVQAASLGRHRDAVRPVHRRADALPDARRRARLHAGAVADQHLVDWTFPAQQHRRAVRQQPVGGRAHEGLRRVDRADALAREARARLGARGQGARHDRPHDRAQQRHHPDRLRSRGNAAVAGRLASLAAMAGRGRRGHNSRPDSARNSVACCRT